MASLNILPLRFVLFTGVWGCQKATDEKEYLRFGTFHREKAALRLTSAGF
jgi:hypothetical protein